PGMGDWGGAAEDVGGGLDGGLDSSGGPDMQSDLGDQVSDQGGMLPTAGGGGAGAGGGGRFSGLMQRGQQMLQSPTAQNLKQQLFGAPGTALPPGRVRLLIPGTNRHLSARQAMAMV